MNKRSVVAILAGLVLLLAACGGGAEPAGPVVTNTPAATVTPTPMSESAAVPVVAYMGQQMLARELHLAFEAVTLVKVEAVEWRDSCLGITRPDALCAAVVTPGYRIILAAGGVEYMYHSNEDGSAIELAVIGDMGVMRSEE